MWYTAHAGQKTLHCLELGLQQMRSQTKLLLWLKLPVMMRGCPSAGLPRRLAGLCQGR